MCPALPGGDLGSAFRRAGRQRDADGPACRATPTTTGCWRATAWGRRKARRRLGRFRRCRPRAGLLADGRAWELVSPAGKGRGEHRTALQGRQPDPGRRGWRTRSRMSPTAPSSRNPKAIARPNPRRSSRHARPQGGASQDVMTAARAGAKAWNWGTVGVPVLLRRPRAEPGAAAPAGKVEPLEAPPLGARSERKDAVRAR